MSDTLQYFSFSSTQNENENIDTNPSFRLCSPVLFPWLPIALDTARLPLTRHVPIYKTTPPRASIRLFSS